MREKILRLDAVLDRTGLSKVSVYRLAAKDEFPSPVQLVGRAVGWYESEVEAWIANRPRSAFVAPEAAIKARQAKAAARRAAKAAEARPAA